MQVISLSASLSAEGKPEGSNGPATAASLARLLYNFGLLRLYLFLQLIRAYS